MVVCGGEKSAFICRSGPRSSIYAHARRVVSEVSSVMFLAILDFLDICSDVLWASEDKSTLEVRV